MSEYSLDEMLKRIKTIKKESHITNEKLAMLTGMPLGTLSKILAGVTKEPSVEAILRIAKALDISADFLIFGEAHENKSDDFKITEQEKEVIMAYRIHPDMQPAINKMLDLKNKEYTSDIFSDIADEINQSMGKNVDIK